MRGKQSKLLIYLLMVLLIYGSLGIVYIPTAEAKVPPGTYTISDIVAHDPGPNPTSLEELMSVYATSGGQVPGRTGWSMQKYICVAGNQWEKHGSQIHTTDSWDGNYYTLMEYREEILNLFQKKYPKIDAYDLFEYAERTGKKMVYQEGTKKQVYSKEYVWYPCTPGEVGAYYNDLDFSLTLSFTVTDDGSTTDPKPDPDPGDGEGGGNGGGEEKLPPFIPQVCQVEVTFSNGDSINESNLIANPNGKITEDLADPDSSKYNVLQYGIPSSEKLRVDGESEKYLHDYQFQQRTGKVTYTIKVAKDFKKIWEEEKESSSQKETGHIGPSQRNSHFTHAFGLYERIVSFYDIQVGDIIVAHRSAGLDDSIHAYVPLLVTDIKFPDVDTSRTIYYEVYKEGEDEVVKEEKVKYERQEKVFKEAHDISFWKIGHLLVYKFNDALFKNYALPSGAVAVANNNMVVVNALHDNADKNHVFTKSCMDIYLGQETVDGGASEPSIPDWQSEAQSNVNQGFNSRVPDVKNDRVQVDGTTNMNDSITRSHGTRPTAIPKAPMVKVSKNNLLIPPTLQNRWKTPSSITSRYSAMTQINKNGGNLQFTGNSPTKINEVTVHTPVVMYAKSTDDKAHDQRLDAPVRVGDSDSDRHAVVLDRPFTVTLPTSGQHLQTSMAPGYGNRDYRKYTKEKEAQFPFDVYSETKQAFYPKGAWVKVPVDQETASFFLPVWVPEGQYTVKFRSIAINAVGVTPEEHHANLNMSYRTPNGSMANHVAYDTVKVDVVGRLYDFRITDVLDPNWEDVFRKNNGLVEHTNKNYWSGLKGIDGGSRGNAEPYTLPVRHGSHPQGYKNVSVKTGYKFRFDMKTKGNMWRVNDAVRVTPKFYFVNKDGSKRREVDVYYHNDSKKFIKVGSSEDTEYRVVKLNEPLRNIPNKQVREMGDYLYKYPTDYGYSSKVNDDSRVKFLRDYERKYSKNSVVTGPYGWQMLSWGLRTFIGPDANTLPNGLQVTADRAKASEQQWYGEYSLPSDLYVVEKGKKVNDHGLKNRMNKDSDIFLRNGYIVVNFTIESLTNGDTDKPVLSYGSGSGNQWQLEGYKRSFNDAYGKRFNLLDGDVMFYHGDRSSGDDYGSNVIH